jgi:hypothetical protein
LDVTLPERLEGARERRRFDELSTVESGEQFTEARGIEAIAREQGIVEFGVGRLSWHGTKVPRSSGRVQSAGCGRPRDVERKTKP